MNRIRVVLHLMTFLFLPVLSSSQTYFPESGAEALAQRFLDLRCRLNVLFVSLQPGFEDFASLSYFRLARGAKVLNAYVSNGESGESDVRGEYPLKLAATLREEASRAMSFLDVETFFINMPDVAAARDTVSVFSHWQPDTLRHRLMRLISAFKPDLILLPSDRSYPDGSPRWEVLRAVVLEAVKRLEPRKTAKELTTTGRLPRWSVERVWIGSAAKTVASLPVEREHLLWKKSYESIGEEAAGAYESLRIQRTLWRNAGRDRRRGEGSDTYRLAYPEHSSRLKMPDQGLPRPVSRRFRWAERELSSLNSFVSKGGKISNALKQLTVVMDTLDFLTARLFDLPARDRRIALQWKLNLEKLRLSLLGIRVHYSISDTIVTQRQLTFLKIDSIAGLPMSGRTEIFFPFFDQGWIINEDFAKRMPLTVGKEYRLLSPESIEYNLPNDEHGLDETSVGQMLFFFIIHTGETGERNFVYRGAMKMFYAPRFTVEVLNPIVRATPSEYLIVQLTNHSRDGVRDDIGVRDVIVSSEARPFRLNAKGQSHIDTLALRWSETLKESTYVFPVTIGATVVARFAARKFSTQVDTAKRIALVPGVKNSPIQDALRRLGVQWRLLDMRGELADQLSRVDVVLVDRRALTFQTELVQQRTVLQEFVKQGGHLLVLSQDAAVWNASPLVQDFQLRASPFFDEETSLDSIPTHKLLQDPNKLEESDWLNWLYQRSYNVVSGQALATAEIPIKTSFGGKPLVVQWHVGSGTITYVDLALQQQLLNIHPGAFRLLANMISY
ncbi:MAG: PIG-L family deacetylase [Ignavibacteriales bacterium]|nr:PIG-L family deacetylase [Ignavibacteriales bacterium]